MLIPRFEPTPLWWKRYAAFVAAVGTRENASIQQSVKSARAQAAAVQPQVLELVDLALTNSGQFFDKFTATHLKDEGVAKQVGAVLSFMPPAYGQVHKEQVSAAIVSLDAAHPRVASAIFADQVTRALADPESTATAATLEQAESQLIARMVMKQDYITALVQSGIVAADDARTVIVDTLLLENSKVIDKLNARVVAATDMFRHMYMLEHPEATLQDVHTRISQLDTLAVTGPLRAESALRAQRAEIGSVAGLATSTPFQNTLLSVSFWAVHDRDVTEAQVAELRDMLEGAAATSTGTCNYDTYLLPTFATSLFKKAVEASAELQELINLNAVCTRFPLLFFSARAALYSRDFMERVFKTYVTDATLRFQLFDNYVSSLGGNKFVVMTKLQMTLWYLLYETRRLNTLLAMQLLGKLYPATYDKAAAQLFVTSIQEHVRDGLQVCESSTGECGAYCVKVKNVAGLHQCINRLPNTLDVVNLPLLQTQTFAPGADVQDQYQVSRLTNTRVPLPVDNAWVRQQAQLYGLEQMPEPAPTGYLRVDQLVAMLCPAYTPTLLAWSVSTVKKLDASSRVRQTLELLGANLLKETAVPTLKQQAALARRQRLEGALHDNPTLMNQAVSFVNECHETWENVVNVVHSPEMGEDILMGAYNCELLLNELMESNSTMYWLLNSTLTSLWKLLGLDAQSVNVASPVDNKTFEFGVTGVTDLPRNNLKVQLFALVAVTLTELALKIVVYFKSFVRFVNATVTSLFSNTFEWICAQVYTMYDYSTRVLSPRLFQGWTDLLTNLVAIVPTSIRELPRKIQSLYSLVKTFDFRSYLGDIVAQPWSFVNSLTIAIKSNYVLSGAMLTTSMLAALWLFQTSMTGGAESASADAAAALNATLPLLQAGLNNSTVTSVIADNSTTLGVVRDLVNLAGNTTLNTTDVNSFVQTVANSTVDVPTLLADTIAAVLNVTSTGVSTSALSSGMSVALPSAAVVSSASSSVFWGQTAANLPAASTAVSTYLAQSAADLVSTQIPVIAQTAANLPAVSTAVSTYLARTTAGLVAQVPAASTYLLQMPSTLAAAAAPAIENGVKVLVSSAASVTPVSSTWATTFAPMWTSSEVTRTIATQLTNQLQCPLASPLDIVQLALPAPPIDAVMTAFETVNVSSPLTSVTSSMTADQITTVLQQVPSDVSLVIPVVATLAATALLYYIDKRSDGALSGAVTRATSGATSSVSALLNKARDMFGMSAKKQEVARVEKTVEKTKFTKKQLKRIGEKLRKGHAKTTHQVQLAEGRKAAAEARARTDAAQAEVAALEEEARLTRERVRAEQRVAVDERARAATLEMEAQAARARVAAVAARVEAEAEDVARMEAAAVEAEDALQMAVAQQHLAEQRARLAQEQVDALDMQIQEQQAAADVAAEEALVLDHDNDVLAAEVQADMEEKVAGEEEVRAEVQEQIDARVNACNTLVDALADVALAAGGSAEGVRQAAAAIQQEVQELAQHVDAGDVNDISTLEASVETVELAVAERLMEAARAPVAAPVAAAAVDEGALQQRLAEFVQNFSQFVDTLPLKPYLEYKDYGDMTFDEAFQESHMSAVDKTLFIINTAIKAALAKRLNAVTVFAAVWLWHRDKDRTLDDVIASLPTLHHQALYAVLLQQYLRETYDSPAVQVQLLYFDLLEVCLPSMLTVRGTETLQWESLDDALLYQLLCFGYTRTKKAEVATFALWLWLATPGVTYETALEVAARKQVSVTHNFLMVSLFTGLQHDQIQATIPLVISEADKLEVQLLAAQKGRAVQALQTTYRAYRRRRAEGVEVTGEEDMASRTYAAQTKAVEDVETARLLSAQAAMEAEATETAARQAAERAREATRADAVAADNEATRATARLEAARAAELEALEAEAALTAAATRLQTRARMLLAKRRRAEAAAERDVEAERVRTAAATKLQTRGRMLLATRLRAEAAAQRAAAQEQVRTAAATKLQTRGRILLAQRKAQELRQAVMTLRQTARKFLRRRQREAMKIQEAAALALAQADAAQAAAEAAAVKLQSLARVVSSKQRVQELRTVLATTANAARVTALRLSNQFSKVQEKYHFPYIALMNHGYATVDNVVQRAATVLEEPMSPAVEELYEQVAEKVNQIMSLLAPLQQQQGELVKKLNAAKTLKDWQQVTQDMKQLEREVSDAWKRQINRLNNAARRLVDEAYKKVEEEKTAQRRQVEAEREAAELAQLQQETEAVERLQRELAEAAETERRQKAAARMQQLPRIRDARQQLKQLRADEAARVQAEEQAAVKRIVNLYAQKRGFSPKLRTAKKFEQKVTQAKKREKEKQKKTQREQQLRALREASTAARVTEESNYRAFLKHAIHVRTDIRTLKEGLVLADFRGLDDAAEKQVTQADAVVRSIRTAQAVKLEDEEKVADLEAFLQQLLQFADPIVDLRMFGFYTDIALQAKAAQAERRRLSGGRNKKNRAGVSGGYSALGSTAGVLCLHKVKR